MEQGKKLGQSALEFLSCKREGKGGSSNLGEEMGCGQVLEFKIIWQQVAFHKILRDSLSSRALQAELQPAMSWGYHNFLAHGAGIKEEGRRVKGSECTLRKYSVCTGILIHGRRRRKSVS